MKKYSNWLFCLVATTVVLLSSCKTEIVSVSPKYPQKSTVSQTQLLPPSNNSPYKARAYSVLMSVPLMSNPAFSFDTGTFEVRKDDTLPVCQVSMKGFDSFGKPVRLMGLVSDTIDRAIAYVRRRTVTDTINDPVTGTEEVFLPNGRSLLTLDYVAGKVQTIIPGVVITDPKEIEVNFATWQECWNYYSDRLAAERRKDWLFDLACEFNPCIIAVGLACAGEYLAGNIGTALYCPSCNK